VRAGSEYTNFLHSMLKLVGDHRDAFAFESISAVPFFAPVLSRRGALSMVHHVVPLKTVVGKVGPLAPIVIGLQDFVTPIVYEHHPIITNSLSTQRELVKSGYSNVRVVRSGADPPPLGEVSIHDKEDIVVVTGPLRPWKRIEDCLRSFSSMPPAWKLIVIGAFESENYRERLEQLASHLHISGRTFFTGRISETSKREVYRKAKIALVTSEKEGWGLSAVEPQTYGCPVVGYDVPGIRDSVRNRGSGILVESGNLGALTDALLELAADTEKRQRLAAGAFSLYRDYTWDNVFEDFYSILTSEMSCDSPS
jgi:glycosyltransferase involved in cell wall biosynthesis